MNKTSCNSFLLLWALVASFVASLLWLECNLNLNVVKTWKVSDKEDEVYEKLVALAAVLEKREDIGHMLQTIKFERGAEVGVHMGLFSRATLDIWKACKKFYLIDIWKHQENYVDIANYDDSVQESLYKKTMNDLKEFKEKIVVLRMYSTEAALRIDDTSLDYVYLDARHDYCGVMEDMRSYWRKLRPGGVMAGHDFHTAEEVRARTPSQDWSICHDGTVNPGAVKGAVQDFAKAHKLKIYTTREMDWPSWILIKNRS